MGRWWCYSLKRVIYKGVNLGAGENKFGFEMPMGCLDRDRSFGSRDMFRLEDCIWVPFTER